MADLQGTVIIAPISPTSTEDQFPTHKAIYGAGGYRTVSNLVERDSISNERREIGMLVWVDEDKRLYRLTSGTSNSDWENLGDGSSFTYEPLSAFDYVLKVIPLAGGGYSTSLQYEPTVLFSSEGDIIMSEVKYT